MRSCLLIPWLLLGAEALAEPPAGHPTLLLKEEQGRRTRIDAPSDETDAALDRVSAERGFSTQDLEAILDRLRAELRREHPRATPRLIAFLYPGSVTAERLRALSEVFVDIELLLDPCDRTVCESQVARYVELLGQALERPVQASGQYRLVFRTLTITAVTAASSADMRVVRLPIAECLKASTRAGGGQALLDSRRHTEEQFEPLLAKAIAQRAAGLRVALVLPPRVSRSPDRVEVSLRVRGDRNRVEEQVIAALSAAERGLQDLPGAPAPAALEVELVVPLHHIEVRRFRCEGAKMALYLSGKLNLQALWQSYVQEVNRDKNATVLDFSEGD